MIKFQTLLEKILKKGNKYYVTDKKGQKILGIHPNRGKAVDQLQAIEASKAKNKN